MKPPRIFWDLFSPTELTVFDLGQLNHLLSYKHACIFSAPAESAFWISPSPPHNIWPLCSVFINFPLPQTSCLRIGRIKLRFLSPLSQTISISASKRYPRSARNVVKPWAEAAETHLKEIYKQLRRSRSLVRQWSQLEDTSYMEIRQSHHNHTLGKVQPRGACVPLGNGSDFPAKVYGSFIHEGMNSHQFINNE